MLKGLSYFFFPAELSGTQVVTAGNQTFALEGMARVRPGLSPLEVPTLPQVLGPKGNSPRLCKKPQPPPVGILEKSGKEQFFVLFTVAWPHFICALLRIKTIPTQAADVHPRLSC